MTFEDAAGPEVRVERVAITRLEVPLREPYRLAFGDQHAFRCLLVTMGDSEGREGAGEAALLAGYTEETVTGAWSFAEDFAPRLIGRSRPEIETMLDRLPAHRAFSGCAFRTALEQTAGHPILKVEGRATLLGGVNSKAADRAALAAEIERLIATGYRTLKLKVGFDLADDLEAVRVVRGMVAGRARLRIDANQGYSTEDGVRFVAAVDPDGVELIEQPCRAGDWDAAVAVKRAALAPIMLDESIYGPDDIRRAADLGCADYIKLKLMKMGGLDRLVGGLRLIRECGMRPVLGNGVATDLGCWMEACVAARHVDNAGEMNGFLRPLERLLDTPLVTDGADIILDGSPRAPDPAKIDAFRVAELRFG